MTVTFLSALARFNDQAIQLRAHGYTVELQQAASSDSVRLRVESEEKLGEIILWDRLVYDEVVADLKTGKFIHERYGKEFLGVSTEFTAFLWFFPVR